MYDTALVARGVNFDISLLPEAGYNVSYLVVNGDTVQLADNAPRWDYQ